jgi:hypothetical protein
LPRAQKRLDQYLDQRWHYERHSLRARAESLDRMSSSKRAEMAEKMANQFSQAGFSSRQFGETGDRRSGRKSRIERRSQG